MVDYSILQSHFIEALGEYIVELEKGILCLEKSPRDKDLIDMALRTAHNIKGGSGNVGLDAIYRFSHHVEDVLWLFKKNDVCPDTNAINNLLQSIDLLRLLMDNFADNKPCDSSLFENWVREKNVLTSRLCRTAEMANNINVITGRSYGY